MAVKAIAQRSHSDSEIATMQYLYKYRYKQQATLSSASVGLLRIGTLEPWDS
jgi:hypothetical protein